MISMTDTINVDPDMRSMLDELNKFYATDDGHLIRALLRERKRRLKNMYSLEGPNV